MGESSRAFPSIPTRDEFVEQIEVTPEQEKERIVSHFLPIIDESFVCCLRQCREARLAGIQKDTFAFTIKGCDRDEGLVLKEFFKDNGWKVEMTCQGLGNFEYQCRFEFSLV